MKCHIIHDSARQDRWGVLLNEIREQGLDYQIWEADKSTKKPHANIHRSHKNIVKWARDNGLPEVCILEDDIKFCDKGAFEYFLSKKPEDFDLYLGGVYSGEVRDGIVKDFSALHLYIINERFYNVFLQAPENNHLDRCMAYKGKFVVCEPFAAIQHGGYSDNSRSIRHNKIDEVKCWKGNVTIL